MYVYVLKVYCLQIVMYPANAQGVIEHFIHVRYYHYYHYGSSAREVLFSVPGTSASDTVRTRLDGNPVTDKLLSIWRTDCFPDMRKIWISNPLSTMSVVLRRHFVESKYKEVS